MGVATRSGTSGYDACPFLMNDDGSATEQRGDVFFGSVQWSGNWKMIVEKTRFAASIAVASMIMTSHGSSKGGESFETPRFTGGFCRSGYGSTSRMIHSYQRRHLMTPQNADRIMPIVNDGWFGSNRLNDNQTKAFPICESANTSGMLTPAACCLDQFRPGFSVP
jgi:alpha-galactosidase